jgi:hypothetical protein
VKRKVKETEKTKTNKQKRRRKRKRKKKRKEVNDRVTGYSPGDYAVPRLAIYRWPCTSTSRLDHH